MNIVFDAVRECSGKETSTWSCVIDYYSICIPSLVTDFSAKIWNLYQRIDGTKNETYKSYRELPAFWVDACMVIDNTIHKLEKAKMSKDKRQQDALLRRRK